MCRNGTDATCCDVDGSCTDGYDDWCCKINGGSPPTSENGFYRSNDGEANAQGMGGILFPATDPGVPIMCPDGTDAACCDVDRSCSWIRMVT